MDPPRLHDLSCVVHVHSTYSDGTATVDELLASARRNRRDVLFLTDHDTMQARRDGWEGWHDGTLLLVGVEISPKGGHLLAFGIEDEIPHDGLVEADIAARVEEAGGLGFAAHPFSRGSRISTRIAPPHAWPIQAGFLTGIELWSLATDAAERWRGAREAVSFLRCPERFVSAPPADHLAEWDRICAERPLVAIGGLDAHQRGFRLPGGRVISPMGNDRWFGLLGTHLLCERPPSGILDEDRRRVLDALRRGRCYLALDHLGDPSGFVFWAQRDGERTLMGEQVDAGGWSLHARSPRSARIRLRRDGEQVAEASGSSLVHRPEREGAFRVEVGVPGAGGRHGFEGECAWIVSNPIYLR